MKLQNRARIPNTEIQKQSESNINGKTQNSLTISAQAIENAIKNNTTQKKAK